MYQRDNPDWVPTLNMVQKGVEPESTSETLMMSPDMLRFRRRQGRDTRKKTSEAAQSLLLLQEPVSCPSEISEAEFETGIACQTTLTVELLDSMTSDLQNLRTENLELHEQVQKSSYKYEEADFKGKNDKVLYYTGLQSFQILLTLFNYLKPCMPERKSISQFRMLILTLMRLRLNVTASFLAYEFDISSATVSRVFTDVIDIMYVRMKPLVFWPSREDLKKTMPMQFRKHFGTKCAVIIDCFEVFIDRPSNLKARAETWSSYKHHNTVKFLIGITPKGTISFISKAWGGRTSDKFITEHSGFLNNIFPGDLILADRGFDIQDSVGSMMAQVKIPSFTKGKSQLAPIDLETTRKIAHVRIHVERVIGTVRQKYTILNGPLPIDFLICKENENLTLIDKIGMVCCACVNLCSSVVDFN